MLPMNIRISAEAKYTIIALWEVELTFSFGTILVMVTIIILSGIMFRPNKCQFAHGAKTYPNCNILTLGPTRVESSRVMMKWL
jgi:hypothetical protein